MTERGKKLLVPALLVLGFLAIFIGKPLFAKTGFNKVAANEETNTGVNAAATLSDENELENDIVLDASSTATSTVQNNDEDNNDDDNNEDSVRGNDLNAELRLDNSLFVGDNGGHGHGDHGGDDGEENGGD